MNILIPNRPLEVESPRGLYHWARIFNRLQRNFFVEPTKLRREKQIEDFIHLNGYYDQLENPDTTNGNLKFWFVYKGDPWQPIL